MAWTAPMTAVANAVFTSSQYNTHVRDNLLETAPAKATAAGRYYVATGANAIAERVPSTDETDNNEATSSTSYADLATNGPAVTVTTGTKAIVWFNTQVANTSADVESYASVAVSGATTIAASDSWAICQDGVGVNQFWGLGTTTMFTTLNAGSNTFTMRYRVSGGLATYRRRNIIVLPL